MRLAALRSTAGTCRLLLGLRMATVVDRLGRIPYLRTTPNSDWDSGYPLTSRRNSRELVRRLSASIGEELVTALLAAPQKDAADIFEQRQRVELLKEKLRDVNSADAKQLRAL